jgi:hypothetical protein
MFNDSRRGAQVLTEDAWVTRSNPKQRNSRTLRLSPPLFPVSQSMHADPHRARELSLRQTHEPSKSGDVVTRFELPTDQALPQLGRNGAIELRARELRNVIHLFLQNGRGRAFAPALLPSVHSEWFVQKWRLLEASSY